MEGEVQPDNLITPAMSADPDEIILIIYSTKPFFKVWNFKANLFSMGLILKGSILNWRIFGFFGNLKYSTILNSKSFFLSKTYAITKGFFYSLWHESSRQ